MIRAAWWTRIDRPREEVFDYIADLENEPKWNPDASNVVRTSAPGPVGLGTTWEEDFARVGHYITTIDTYERPSVLSFDAKNPRTDAHVRFDFAADGDDATGVSCVVELTMKGGMRLLEPLLASRIRKQIEQDRPASLSHAFDA
ncbi:MAG TPA: SRPBCC family protein [Gaiellaceae bacterium]|nr:SRPBCC family protein [Gaiellaceae bacterium]